MAKRTIVYIDGFNLYWGCLARTAFKWLDLVALADDLVGNGHRVSLVKYFTARVDDRPDDPGQSQRQDVFLRALRAHCGNRLDIIFGHFTTHATRKRLVTPHSDGTTFARVLHTTEKASDVNLASHLVWDACHSEMDVALVVSNDSDLQTPVDMAMKCGRSVAVVNPQIIDRSGRSARRQRPNLTGNTTRKLSTGRLRRSQLPDPVVTKDGRLIHSPPGWRTGR